MPYWIKAQKKLFPLGQPIRSDGPSSHLSKKGTPTLGGVLIIACLSFSTILWTSNFSKFNYDFNGTTQKITCELNTGYMQELYDKLTYNNYDEYAGLNINKILYDIFPVQDKISETMRERMINQMEKIDKLIDEYQTPQDPSGNKFTGEMNKILGKKNIFKIEDGNITFSVAYENDK